jgi:hypothetical protein
MGRRFNMFTMIYREFQVSIFSPVALVHSHPLLMEGEKAVYGREEFPWSRRSSVS